MVFFDGSSSTSCCHFVHKMDLSRPLTDNFARCFIDDGNDRIIYTTKKTASTHRPLTYARFDCPLTYARHSLNYHHRTYARHNLPLTYGRRYQWHPQTSTRCLLRLQLRLYVHQNFTSLLYAVISMATTIMTWLLHHNNWLRLHQLINNNSRQSVRVITIVQDTPAMTTGGNRGGDKGRHQKERIRK